MTRQRLALVILTVSLSVSTPTLTFAANPSRSEAREPGRDDHDSLISRTIKSIKHLITRALEGPMIPPPSDHH